MAGSVSKTIILTTGTTWTVPDDWSDVGSIIRCIGAGGGGGRGVANSTWQTGGGGGGGGAYAQVSAIGIKPGDIVNINIGVGGTGATANSTAGTAGSNTWINKAAASAPTVTTNGALAVGGNGGAAANGTSTGAGGIGGNSAISVGTIVFSGGTGGATTNATPTNGIGGGGGGAAATVNAVGGNGGAATTVADGGGGGGGGTYPTTTGRNGSNNSTTSGGNGGLQLNGSAGGLGGTTAGANGGSSTNGGGGGGGAGFSAGGAGNAGSGGTGGTGVDYTVTAGGTAGSGGGGGGGGGTNNSNGVGGAGGAGALYGGGGGGGGGGQTGANGGSGANGVIIISYNVNETLYWVGGSGTWDGTSRTNWSETSGGTGGFAAPSALINTIFDASSDAGAGFTITLGAGAVGANLTMTAVDQTVTIAGSANLVISGNSVTLPSTATITPTYTGYIRFTDANANGTTVVITGNGKSLANVEFSNINKPTTTTFTVSTGGLTSTSTTLLTAGNLNLDSSLTTDNFDTSSDTYDRKINYGTGTTINLTGNSKTIWNAPNTTKLTLVGSPARITCTAGTTGTRTINHSSVTGLNIFSTLDVNVTGGTDSVVFTSGSTIGNLNFTGFGGTWINSTLDLLGNLTISTGMTVGAGTNVVDFTGSELSTVTSNGKTFDFPVTISKAAPTGSVSTSTNWSIGSSASRTLLHSSGDLNIGGATLTIYGKYDCSSITTRSITSLGGTIALSSNLTETIIDVTALSLTVSGTVNVQTTGGGATTKTINAGQIAEGSAFNYILNNTAGTVAFTSGNIVNNLTINGTFTISNVPITLYGNYTYTAGTLSSGTNAFTFAATSGTKTINSGGTTQPFPFIINGTGGTFQLLTNALTLSSDLTVTAGTFNPNNLAVSVVNLNVNGGTVGTAISNLTVSGTTTYSSGTLNGNGTQSHAAFTQSGTTTFDITNNTSTTVTGTYTLTAGTITLGTKTLNVAFFSSNNTNTRTIGFGTGKIVVNGATTATIWDTGTVTNLTITGTPLVETTGGGATTKTINAGQLAEASSISFSLLNTAGNVAFTSGNTIRNFILNGTFTLNNVPITIYGNYTLILLTAISAGSSAWTFASTNVTARTINTAGVTHTFPFIINGSGGTFQLLTNGLTLSSDLTITAGTFNPNSLAVSVVNLNINGGTYGTATTTLTVSGTTTFTSGTFNTNGTQSHANFTENGTVTVDLTNTTTFTVTGAYTLTAGTLALGTKTLTTKTFVSNNSNTRTINFGTGKISITSALTETIWDTSTVTNLTISGTPLVETIGSGVTTKTINSGQLAEASSISFSILNSAGTVAFTLNNTVRNLILNGAFTLSNVAITIYGNYTYTAGTIAGGANAWTFAATGAVTRTIVTGNVTHDIPFTINGSGATFTVTTNPLTLGSTRALTLTAGTLNPNSLAINVGSFVLNGGTLGTAITTFTVVGNAAFSAGTLATNGTHSYGSFTQSGTTSVDLTNNTSFTVSGLYTHTSGTLTLATKTLSVGSFDSSNANVRTIAFGTGKITVTSALTETIWNTSTITNLTVTGTPTVETTGGGNTTKTINSGQLPEATAINFSILNTLGTVAFTDTNTVKNLTLNGTFTLSSNSITIYGNYTYTAATLTAGTGTWTFAATGAVTRTIVTGNVTHDFNMTVNGSGATFTVTTNPFTLGSSKTLTVTSGTFNPNNLAVNVGNLTVNGGTVSTSITTLTVQNDGIYSSGTLNGNGTQSYTTFTQSGTTTLDLTNNTAFTVSGLYTHTSGTITLASKVLTVGSFNSSNTNTRTIGFGTGRIDVTSSLTETVWDTGTITNLTISGTTNVKLIGSGATTKTINAGQLPEANTISFEIAITAGTVAFTTSNTVKNLTFTDGAYNVSNIALTIYGNLTVSGNTLSFDTGANAWTFAATSGTQTISTSGEGIVFPVVLSGTGTYSFAGSATIGTSSNSRSLTLTTGTISLGTSTLTIFGQFISNGTGVRSINFGTGKIVLSSNNTETVWDTGTVTNLTTSGTPLVELNGSGATTKTINSGILNEANSISFSILNTAGTVTFTSGNTVRNLILNGTFTLTNVDIIIYGNYTNTASTLGAGASALTFAATSGIKTINTGNATHDFPITVNGSGGTFQLTTNPLTIGSAKLLTVTAGTLDPNNLAISTGFLTVNGGTIGTAISTLTVSGDTIYSSGTLNGNGTQSHSTFTQSGTTTYNITNNTSTTITGLYTLTGGTITLGAKTLNVGSFNSNNSNTRTIGFGTGKIVVTSALAETIWDTGTVTGLTISGTTNVETTGGGTTIKTINTGQLAEASSLSFNLLNTAGTVTFTTNNTLRNLTVNGTFTLSNVALTIYGNYTYTTASALTAGSNVWTFATTSSQTLTLNNTVHDWPFTLSGTGTYNIGSNFNNGTSKAVTLTTGTLNAATFNMNIGTFSSSGTGLRTITLGSGTWNVQGSGASAWDTSTSTNLTVSASTANINMLSTSAKTFSGGGRTWPTLTQAGVGTLTIVGNNTFANIFASAYPSTILFTGGSTTTITNTFNPSGTDISNYTTVSSTNSTNFTISKATGTVQLSYVNLSYSTATGGATFNSDEEGPFGNIDSGRNIGWFFVREYKGFYWFFI